MKKKRGLWQALERLAGGAVMAEWTRELGDEYERARRFLRPTPVEADTYPCVNRFPCECRHRVEKAGRGGRIAVCDCDDCPPIRLADSDVVVFEPNIERLAMAMARAGRWQSKPGDAGVAGAWQVGYWVEKSLPVVLVACADARKFRDAVGVLVARFRGGFVLCVPAMPAGDVTSLELLHSVGGRLVELETQMEVAGDGSLRARGVLGEIAGSVPESRASGRAASSAARYVLRWGLKGWLLVFGGKQTTLPNWKGVKYAAVLLSEQPGEWIHGKELGARACGHAVIVGQRNLASDDEESFEGKRKARKEWQAVIDDPDATDLERREAVAEQAKIDEWAVKNLRGTVGGEQKQIRAIRQALRRLLEHLEKSEDETLRSFGAHLDRYLWKPSARSRGGGRRARVRAGLAGKFIYERPDGVSWSQ